LNLTLHESPATASLHSATPKRKNVLSILEKSTPAKIRKGGGAAPLTISSFSLAANLS